MQVEAHLQNMAFKTQHVLHLPDAPKGAVSGSLTTNQATTGIASDIVPTAMVPLKMILQNSPCAEK